MLLVSFAGFIGSGSKEKSSFRKEFQEKALPPLSKKKGGAGVGHTSSSAAELQAG